MGRAANAGLQDELKKDFGEMPGPAKLKLKDYAVINVAPSVVPTYLPGIRIYRSAHRAPVVVTFC